MKCEEKYEAKKYVKPQRCGAFSIPFNKYLGNKIDNKHLYFWNFESIVYIDLEKQFNQNYKPIFEKVNYSTERLPNGKLATIIKEVRTGSNPNTIVFIVDHCGSADQSGLKENVVVWDIISQSEF